MPEAQHTFTVQLNGEPRQMAVGASLAALLEQLGVATSQVAVEVNRQLVPRAYHSVHWLADGDRIEIVTLVGGG